MEESPRATGNNRKFGVHVQKEGWIHRLKLEILPCHKTRVISPFPQTPKMASLVSEGLGLWRPKLKLTTPRPSPVTRARIYLDFFPSHVFTPLPNNIAFLVAGSVGGLGIRGIYVYSSYLDEGGLVKISHVYV